MQISENVEKVALTPVHAAVTVHATNIACVVAFHQRRYIVDEYL